MPEALSQAQIESLMMSMEPTAASPGVGSSPLRQKLVKSYDFRRPDKFSKEHLRALRNLHESYSRLLASAAASFLRAPVQVRLAEFEQTPFSEYVHSLPTPTLLYVLSLAPLPGQAVLQVDLDTARAIVERLLGGPGGPSSQVGDMTEIELTLLKSLGRTLIDPLSEAWAPVYPVALTSKEPVLSAEFAQVAMPGEATIVFFFEISLFNMTGSLSLCIPHPVIHSALDDLAAQLWAGTGSTNGTEHERLNPGEQLAPVEVLLAAELGRTEMTMQALVALAPDQIVKLNTPANGAIVLRVAGREKFTGRPGVVGKNLAVQIVRALP